MSLAFALMAALNSAAARRPTKLRVSALASRGTRRGPVGSPLLRSEGTSDLAGGGLTTRLTDHGDDAPTLAR